MKNKINKFFMVIGLIMLIVLSVTIYNIAFATEESNENLDVVRNPNSNLATGIVYGNIPIATYRHSSVGETVQNINTLLNELNNINNDPNVTLATNTSVFCVRHHQALPKYKDNLNRNYNSDFDVSPYITFTIDSTPTISTSKFSDYMEHRSTATETTKSNIRWKATETDMKSVTTPYGSYNTNVFIYATAFSQKQTEGYTGGIGAWNYYGLERAQRAIWGVTGYWYDGEKDTLQATSLYRAGKALDEYEAEAGEHGSTPTVTVCDNAGTILLGDNTSNYQYKIGPFDMDDYAYAYSTDAENYSGGLIGGIASGKLILNNGTEIAIDGSSCRIEYSDDGDNDRDGTYFIAPPNYKYPWPDSTFYIVVNKSLCGDATTLNELSFNYQSTRADGEGWVCECQFVQTTWSRVDITDTPNHTYYCLTCWGSHECTGSSTSHNNGEYRTCSAECDGSTNYCEHGSWKGHCADLCDKCQCDGMDKWVKNKCTCGPNTVCTGHGGYWKCTHSHDYCSTGYCSQGYEDGEHGDHETKYHCNHGYTWCESFNWEADMSVQYGQPLLAVKEATVYVEQQENISFVDVRLTTDISIDKYISKVEHTGESGVIYGEDDSRFGKTTSDKIADSIKVERGDKVTFKIVLTNHQDEEAKVKIRDILPNNDGYKITPHIGDWLTVQPDTPTEIIVTVIANDKTGTANNTAKIITRNAGNKGSTSDSVDYPKTIDRNGPVVNIAELNGRKLEDADYYTIKEYDVSLDKSIVQVKHMSNDEITYSGNGRKNIDENSKQASPVYVEYGDEVTYEIDIYNTTSPYTADRTAAPYWEPDKAYVDIEDKLPSKYTDLNVSVSNNTGNISIGSGKFTINDIMVPANGSTRVTVKLVVNEHDRTVQEENRAKLISQVQNINKYDIKNNSTKNTTADYYHLNDYNISIDKYINMYYEQKTIDNNNDGFTAEETVFSNRYDMSEDDKKNRPLQVEQTETLQYALRLNNEATSASAALPSGEKYATSVRPTIVRDTLDDGLELDTSSVYAKIYTSGGGEKMSVNVTAQKITDNIYDFVIPNKMGGQMTMVEPGEYIIFYATVEITESNMYLYSLKNEGYLEVLTNINNTDSITREVKNENWDENIGPQKYSRDYVKMKDLVIAGKVWLDYDKDGLIGKSGSGQLNGKIDASANISTNIEAPTGDTEYAMENIHVKLYDASTDTVVRITKTDSKGLYTFGKNEAGNWYNGTYSFEDSVTESKQRIDKATGKDENKNYTKDSVLKEYYIEYEYDGLVYKSTTIYAGKSHLNSDGTMQANYPIDSNASEFKSWRDEFNEDHEIISFDKASNADLSNNTALEYEKEGHNSWLKENYLRVMKSRSFIIHNPESTDNLWLFKQTSNFRYPETDYLKYINLGLEQREDVDLSITQDVYEVKTTINGDEMTYEYNQNDYTLGNPSIDKEQSASAGEEYNSELYMTGSSPFEPIYEFKVYNSDYNYKVDQYNLQAIKDYKGTESELNVQTTFRIKVTNHGITDDEPYAATKDIKVYTGINEVVEYYDEDFMTLNKVDPKTGAVNELTIKTEDADGYLVDTPVKVVKAEYVMKDGTRHEAILSATSEYTDARTIDGYQTLYIRPIANSLPKAGEIIIGEDESVDILVTFNIEKDAERYINLGDFINVAEISAYSTYYKNDGGSYYAAGLVDKDSNPGNTGEPYNGTADDEALYEDDTFKTGIKFELQPEEKERALNGFVWDDARSLEATDEDGKQYIGDGKYDTSVGAIAKAKKNQSVANKEENDIAIKDMKTKLVEMVAIPVRDASGAVVSERVYKDTIYANGSESIMTVRTDAAGKYELKGYIPGDYIVKFFYGDDATLENMLIFNGQDYKSTTYQSTEMTYAEMQANPDDVLRILEKPNISDAKDDEIARLETISYSETMTNSKNRILRGKDSINKDVLIENTKMESETAEFLVKTEKEMAAKKVLTYEETTEKFTNEKRHPINNIDFGIEYRPELQVALNKFISNLKIVTSDENTEDTATPLVDAKFDEYYGVVVRTDVDTGATEFLTNNTGKIVKVGRYATNAQVENAVAAAGADISKAEKGSDGKYVITLAGTELNVEDSIGLSNLQYVENEFDRDIAGNLFVYDAEGDVKATQGFVYLNIDDSIMQGATVTIEYVFSASNLSEIDRISSNLSVLRFKENDEAKTYRVADKYYDQVSYQLGENTGYIDLEYSAAATARNKLFSEYYEYELTADNQKAYDAEGFPIKYRIKDKKLVVDGNKKALDTEYYGRYLGSLYYTGVIGDKDIVAELKIDKILDYIDNDLVFDNSKNNGENNLWKTTTAAELEASDLVGEDSFRELTAAEATPAGRYLLDSKNRTFNTAERSNLAILLDDRVKDYANPADDTTVNKDISKYLTPRYSYGAESFGTVKLLASKIISTEETSEDMNYENIGEIVQYSSVTGRVTNLATTLGNVKFLEGTTEWDESRKESDTAATEKITLTPPTGLNRVNNIIRNTVEGASYTVIAIIAVAVVCVGVIVSIAIYRKRRIK